MHFVCKTEGFQERFMIPLDQHPSGRHFLQIPGPSPVPEAG